MRNYISVLAVLLILTGCSTIDKLKNAVETIEEVAERYEKKDTIDKVQYALLEQENLNSMKVVDVKQRKVVNSSIKEAILEVKKYQKSANNKKDTMSADKALQSLQKADHYFSLNKYNESEDELKSSLQCLLNNKIIRWQFQTKGKHVYPNYLKNGTPLNTNNENIVHNPNSLAFSGGGARGPAYAGVLKYLQEKDKFKNVKRFVGTSAGSIMCTFMSVGTYYENNREEGSKPFWELIYEMVEKENFIDFIDNPALREVIKQNSIEPITNNILTSGPLMLNSMDEQYALCDGNVLLKFFKKYLVKFGFDANITLGELYKKTGIHLVLVSGSLSYRKAAYFDYESAPDLPVVLAMRASMAIPYIFKPIKYNNDFFVDGGTANNYPIDYFDYIISKKEAKPVTLGLMLFSRKEILRPNWNVVGDIMGYTNAIINLISINTGSALFGKNIDRTVFIDCGEVDILSFDINNKQKRKLMQAGYDAMKNYYGK